jgi:hypothetical protein
MKLIKSVMIVISFFIGACSSTLVLEPADFSWPLESVVKVSDDGVVTEKRYSFSFNTKGLFYKEAGDSLAYLDRDIRIIRDVNGYYFMTAKNFKNVYIFSDDEKKMSLHKEILIDENGIKDPAFNQRKPYIEFMDGEKIIRLTNEGIINEE